ncbi:MAG: flagellar basal body rod protein FlgC [Betaproteobacteria bacterium]|nr:flagellar basal body rod protein FlgC [Betaproteobacteria bacterium]
MMDNIFGIAGTALNAQLTRMNATASNLANASTVATTSEEAFRAKRPLFKTIVEDMLNKADTHNGQDIKGGVKIDKLVDDPAPVRRQFDPYNPVADKDGYVYQSNVNEVSEMVEMMAAARSYQNNVETVNTAKHLMMRTLDVMRS